MKRLPRGAQRADVAGRAQLLDRLGGQPAADHRVVDALARGRRHHAGGIAGQHHVAAVVPAPHRPQRDRRALAPDRLEPVQPGRRAQLRHRRAQREALVRGAGADARGVAVREHPAVEIGRERALVVDVAARRVVRPASACGRADDLVVGEDVADAVGARHALLRDRRISRRRHRSPRGRARCDSRRRRLGRVMHHARCRRGRASMRSKVPVAPRRRPAVAARSRSHSSNTSRSTMPTKPPSIGMSTSRREGDDHARRRDAGDQQVRRESRNRGSAAAGWRRRRA